MHDMRTPHVVDIQSASTPRARARRQMRDLAAAARTAAAAAADPNALHPAFEEPAGRGRAWLNGREIGGPDRRYVHLTRAYE
jgi:hypothetical protein